MPSEITTLTNSERLLIQRRRRKETQAQAAHRWRTSLSRYSFWERGYEDPPSVKVGQLKPHERCLLYRRRAGYSQQQVAEDLGFCRHWINRMENGLESCDDLLWYWEQ